MKLLAHNVQRGIKQIEKINYQKAVTEYERKKQVLQQKKQRRIETIYYSGRWKELEGSNRFISGNCTQYVASKTVVPWNGNAGAWIQNAQAHGYDTTDTPEAGDIVVTNESRYGHVAYIEEVYEDGTVLVSEGNYKGYGIESHRELSLQDSIVKGVIDM